MIARWALLLVLSAVGRDLPAATWIVDPGGGGHFSDLPAAVAASSPGDVLLLRAGSYTATPIAHMLSIYGGRGGGTSTLVGATSIHSIAAGCLVHLRDLEFTNDGVNGGPALRIASCAGTVILDRCRILKRLLFCSSAGLEIDDCRAVILNDGLVEGELVLSVATTCTRPVSGIAVHDSHLTCHRGVISGTDAYSPLDPRGARRCR